MVGRPTLVILPGWGGTQETWTKFTDLARREYSVVCINLPCFGDEPCPADVWGVADYATFVENKIKHLYESRQIQKDEPLIILGHSFGGQIAAYLVATRPHIAQGLILSGPAIIRPRHGVRRFVLRYVTNWGKWMFRLPLLEQGSLVVKKIWYRVIDSPDYADTSGIKREIFKKIIREDVRYLLPSILLPTLILWGEHDTYTPLVNSKIISKSISQSELRVITDGTHGLHIHNTEEFFRYISDFVYHHFEHKKS